MIYEDLNVLDFNFEKYISQHGEPDQLDINNFFSKECLYFRKPTKTNYMKTFLLMLGLCGLLPVNSFCQSGDAETIKKLNQDWLTSIANKDSAALSKILADDFVLIVPNGSKHTKKDNLINIMSRDIEFSSIHADSVEVRMLTQDVGIISCWTSFVAKTGGKEMAGKNCYQDVYVKRKDRWVAVSGHVTMLGMH